MKAPVDGDVVELIARRGDVLTPGDPLLKIVEANPRQVIAYLEEARSSPVREGNTALMRRHDRAGAPVIGTVKSVSGTVAQMPSRFWPAPSVPRWGRQVFIQVDPGQRLVPGEAFDVAFEAKGQE
jgi:multidrug resistance efflux pump